MVSEWVGREIRPFVDSLRGDTVTLGPRLEALGSVSDQASESCFSADPDRTAAPANPSDGETENTCNAPHARVGR